MNPVLQYWYFHLPNFVLAAVMYTLIGRLLLSFFVPVNWQNYIWRAFVRITDPIVGIVRLITPAALPIGPGSRRATASWKLASGRSAPSRICGEPSRSAGRAGRHP